MMLKVSYPAILWVLLVIKATTGATWSSNWMKKVGNVDFSHLTLWHEVAAESKGDCIQRCHWAYCQGCGYNSGDQLCHMYLDWGNSTNWTQEQAMDYYVPISDGIFMNGWIDMRRYEINYALLPETQSMNQPEATALCESWRGNLYVMDTDKKRQALKEEFQRQGITLTADHEIFWFGLELDNISGLWNWVTGETVALNSSYWADGEPNNMDGNQRCAITKQHTDYKMDDFECSNAHRPLCEFPLYTGI